MNTVVANSHNGTGKHNARVEVVGNQVEVTDTVLLVYH